MEGLGQHRINGAELAGALVRDAVTESPLVTPADGQLIIDLVIEYMMRSERGRAEFRLSATWRRPWTGTSP